LRRDWGRFSRRGFTAAREDRFCSIRQMY